MLAPGEFLQRCHKVGHRVERRTKRKWLVRLRSIAILKPTSSIPPRGQAWVVRYLLPYNEDENRVLQGLRNKGGNS